jgi:hypothetical protein
MVVHLEFKMKDGWWWYWTSGVLMGMVFAIILLGYRFDLIIPMEAYVFLAAVSLFSGVFFVLGCRVEK